MVDLLTVLVALVVVIEPVLVVAVAPRITRRLTEKNAVSIFEAHLLPRIKAALDEKMTTLGEPPTPEQQADAQAALKATLAEAIREVLKSNATDAAKTLSDRAQDSRVSYAAREEEFILAVMDHERGGPLVVAAVEQFKEIAPAAYKLAVRGGPERVGAFLEKHGDKLTLGMGKFFGGKSTSNGIPYIGGGGKRSS